MKRTLTIFVAALVVACSADEKPKPLAGDKPKVIEEVPARADYAEPSDRASLATPPPDAERTPSGLASLVLHPGSGKNHPRKHSVVRVHYVGWTSDGQVFDSSRARGEPAEFGLDKVIAGWTEGVPLMVVGEERRFWIPAELAYGNGGRQGTPQGALTFDVELLAIVSTPMVPDVPPDVAAAPSDAKRTSSGLAYKTLTPGDGDRPDKDDMISIEFTGWTPDGRMFDSTFTNDHGPTTFHLGRGIPGWVEGIQLMRVGETTRFWIPQKLFFGDKPPEGQPKGDVVFDIHLVEIVD